MSPGLWWDKESLLSYQPNVLKSNFINPISVFVAVGKEGKTMEHDTKRLVNILRQGQRKNITVNYEYFINENHASILHNAVYKGLKTINRNSKKNN